MAWFMYQPLNVLFHSFLNQFQKDGECSHSSLKQANKPLCFLSVLLSNNTGFPRASCPTCPGSSPPMIKKHPFPSQYQVAGLGWQWVRGYQLWQPAVQGLPFCPLIAPLVFTADFPKKCLTASCRQFKPRAQLYLQTYTMDLNFNIILL